MPARRVSAAVKFAQISKLPLLVVDDGLSRCGLVKWPGSVTRHTIESHLV